MEKPSRFTIQQIERRLRSKTYGMGYWAAVDAAKTLGIFQNLWPVMPINWKEALNRSRQ